MRIIASTILFLTVLSSCNHLRDIELYQKQVQKVDPLESFVYKDIFTDSKKTKLWGVKTNNCKEVVFDTSNNFDIVVNATNLGLKGGEEFKNLFNDVKDNLIYIDTIYNPLQTKMIKHLKAKNIKTFNGLDMFIYQGQKSFYLWNKVNPEIDNELIELLNSKLK